MAVYRRGFLGFVVRRTPIRWEVSETPTESDGSVSASFRDPGGRVYIFPEHVFRSVSTAATPTFREFLNTHAARQLTEAGKLIETAEIATKDTPLADSALFKESSEDAPACVFEHDRVWFPSYVYEWPPEMLHSAAMLTLEVAELCLLEGFGLKDATPYNILFRGARPVFIDVLSFERRRAGDYLWLPYAQFLRMFLLPLLAQKHFGISFDRELLLRPHGLEPEDVYIQSGWAKRLQPQFLNAVSLPVWLAKWKKKGKDIYRPRQLADAAKAQFILRAQLRRLRRMLHRSAPERSRSSHWADYMHSLSYSGADFQTKERFVESAIEETKPGTVLDIGCNTGHFSAICARRGARVVAIDLDSASVGATWRRAISEQLDILPLRVNIAWPTPATGWRNAEYSSFLTRAFRSFEMVMLLATLHHLLVTDRIPLREVISLISQMTTRYALIEYVPTHDPMFREIVRGREALHESLTQEAFEGECRREFSTVRSKQVGARGRTLYLLEKFTA